MMNKFTLFSLMIFVGLHTQAQLNAAQEADAKKARTDNIIKKNLEAKETSAEEIEKIIIEGQRDPEYLPKKKKTVEQKLEEAINPKATLADPPPIGYQVQCIKECRGPFCCTWIPGPRSYLMPDTAHK
jgi:hypothetical protein